MVTIRYIKLSTGKFSDYLDVYFNTGEGKSKRNYEFLKIYAHKDYSDASCRISEPDREKLKIIKALRNKREDELNFFEHGYKQPAKIKTIQWHSFSYPLLLSLCRLFLISGSWRF